MGSGKTSAKEQTNYQKRIARTDYNFRNNIEVKCIKQLENECFHYLLSVLMKIHPKYIQDGTIPNYSGSSGKTSSFKELIVLATFFPPG